MSPPSNVSTIKKDLTGSRFGRLFVVGLSHQDTRRKAYWDTVCDCGGTKKVAGYNLGLNVNSCGCLQKESRFEHSTTHGKRRTRTYNIWAAMVQRCTNPNTKFFHRYGGRGITVCASWTTFQGFLDDMGECPEGKTIERLDNDAGYSKENCKWAGRNEQARNKSSSRVVVFDGKSMSLADWADHLGLGYKLLHNRLNKHGWPVERAFTTPPRIW